MAKCRSRDAILSYLSTFNVKSRDTVNTQEIVDWCEVNFSHYNLERTTYEKRMSRMTITVESRETTNPAHPDGLDDVFFRDDMGTLRRI
ncbi:MAG: hypothetical protein HOE76_02405 [Euryarchaeota archaeon]|jgi:hypothetical protein|nr:hypothetical protein [Euryarchaeota archaeon]MBT4981913.1 hypothetical protein [Euryarchaeota archaeon]MBT5183627.1 hypothetical protein [Euryarchaeota archaeon]